MTPTLKFELPQRLLATAPAEERGIARDAVRMMVATPDGISHRRAIDLPSVLQPGDLLVINDSRTMPASLNGTTPDGEHVEVHLSTVVPEAGVPPAEALSAQSSEWVVELRKPGPTGSEPSYVDRTGAIVALPHCGRLRVHSSHPVGHTSSRLWEATISTPRGLESYLAAVGDPVRYGYVERPWPINAYRTVFGRKSGSAEMPSAARPFTWRLLRRLAERGIQIEPLTLHCGVSSLESGDPPYAEWFSVPEQTARAVQLAREDGRRVIAIGTTVVRALESAVDHGVVKPAEGWTNLVITPGRGVSTVDGMISGWHESDASHLQMLEAVAGKGLLEASYREALRVGYLWHEFGDIHLIVR
jgi:S-adenosylmethionine:tRNA ribosyltransferase-isomerase